MMIKISRLSAGRGTPFAVMWMSECSRRTSKVVNKVRWASVLDGHHRESLQRRWSVNTSA